MIPGNLTFSSHSTARFGHKHQNDCPCLVASRSNASCSSIAASPASSFHLHQTLQSIPRNVNGQPHLCRPYPPSLHRAHSNTRQDAIDALNSLQTPYHIIEYRRKAGIRPDATSMREMKGYLRRIGYTVCLIRCRVLTKLMRESRRT